MTLRPSHQVAVVDFGDKLKAKSLLACGQSGDPASMLSMMTKVPSLAHMSDRIENNLEVLPRISVKGRD